MKIDKYIDSDFLSRELAKDVREGLGENPKELPPKWFYDEKGSRIFEEMMEVEDYYLTNREREILCAYADEIAAITQVDTFVELGSGNSEKTLLLLKAMSNADHSSKYIPFDVDESAVRAAISSVRQVYPQEQIHGVVGDFHYHLPRIPREGTCLIGILGSTIGNFRPQERKEFLTEVADFMNKGDFFLLGTDLIKEEERLMRAYNDSEGINAEFNLNVLNVLNRELDADFKLENFEHKVRYDSEENWIEMRLKSTRPQEVFINKLDMSVKFEKNEEILTEVSAKFSRDGIAKELETAGLSVVNQWSDPNEDYLITLSQLRQG